MTANQVLRDYRLKHRLTREEMAGLLGLAEVTVRSLENGNRSVTPERARLIEDATTTATRAGKVKRPLTRWELMPEFFGERRNDGRKRRAEARTA